MTPRRYVPAEVWDLAVAQAGVVSRFQLRGLGFSAAAVDRMRRPWTWLGPGMYWLAPPLQEPPFLTRVWAGVLFGGAGARAGLGTAAVLHGLAHPDEMSSYWSRTTPGLTGAGVCILTPNDRRSAPGVVFLRERSGERMPSRAAESPRAGVEDTALDLAARGDRSQIVTWITRAVQRRLTTTDRLARRLDERPTLRHRRLIIPLLADVAEGATTPLEVSALREVFRPHGLPKPELQMRVGPSLIDAVYRKYRLVIELDGQLGHVEEGRFRDRRRDNRHAELDVATLRFGWDDVVADPCAVARQVARVLHRQGWQGEMTPCLRCRPGR